MRSLKNKPQVIAPTNTYPHGRIQDDDGSGTKGTPVNEVVYGDYHQFFMELMKDANLTPNEIAENEYDGFQLNTALGLFINKLILAASSSIKKLQVNIGNWNMGSNASVIVNLPIYYTQVRKLSALIIADNGKDFYDLEIPGSSGVPAAPQGSIQISDVSYTNTVTLYRLGGGTFVSGAFNSTSVNRGYLIIDYV